MTSSRTSTVPSADTPAETPLANSAVICVDFGSTFTKTSLVDVDEGRVVAAAEHRTTVDTDVLDGYDACLTALVEQDPRAAHAEVLACSSAGGGLRIAVIGNEELVTAEAGRRAGKPVGVCGEAAADPLLACALVGMGITSLSMASAATRPVGARLAGVTFQQCEEAAEAALAATDPAAARAAVLALLT